MKTICCKIVQRMIDLKENNCKRNYYKLSIRDFVEKDKEFVTYYLWGTPIVRWDYINNRLLVNIVHWSVTTRNRMYSIIEELSEIVYKKPVGINCNKWKYNYKGVELYYGWNYIDDYFKYDDLPSYNFIRTHLRVSDCEIKYNTDKIYINIESLDKYYYMVNVKNNKTKETIYHNVIYRKENVLSKLINLNCVNDIIH